VKGAEGVIAALAVLFAAATAAADEPPNVARRPTYLRVDGGLGAPTGVFGFTAGHAIEPPWAAEVGGGLGLSGFQLAVLARWYRPIGESQRHVWTAAAGPSVSLLGETLGFHVQHADDVTVEDGDVFFIAGLNVEIGWEVRFGWGGLLRVSIGAFVRLAENMSGLCPEETSGDLDGPCGSPHFPTPPEIARVPAYPYLGFGYGWSF
jgi:hypothetical protein